MSQTIASRAETANHLDVVRAIRAGRRSRRGRATTVSVSILLLTAIVVGVNLSVGDFPVKLGDVVSSLFGYGTHSTVFIVQELRLPRVLTGLLVGFALGGSGAIFQAVARNPLASPDILGVTSGAGVGAVFVITTRSAGFAEVAAAGFLGALAITTLIYLLAYRRGVSVYRFILVGIGLGAMATALIGYLLIKTTLFSAADATAWLSGTLNARGWETASPLMIALGPLAAAAILLSHRLSVLQLGDDVAVGLGLPVERARLALVMVGVALAGVGVAAAGPIAFVALMAPAIARRLTRAPAALVTSMLVGGLLVVTADLVGRRLFAPLEVQVGVITGILGAPFLLWLLVRANRIGEGG